MDSRFILFSLLFCTLSLQGASVAPLPQEQNHRNITLNTDFISEKTRNNFELVESLFEEKILNKLLDIKKTAENKKCDSFDLIDPEKNAPLYVGIYLCDSGKMVILSQNDLTENLDGRPDNRCFSSRLSQLFVYRDIILERVKADFEERKKRITKNPTFLFMGSIKHHPISIIRQIVTFSSIKKNCWKVVARNSDKSVKFVAIDNTVAGHPPLLLSVEEIAMLCNRSQEDIEATMTPSSAGALLSIGQNSLEKILKKVTSKQTNLSRLTNALKKDYHAVNHTGEWPSGVIRREISSMTIESQTASRPDHAS